VLAAMTNICFAVKPGTTTSTSYPRDDTNPVELNEAVSQMLTSSTTTMYYSKWIKSGFIFSEFILYLNTAKTLALGFQI
jgi:hypothetical protein